ncbi:hypothetical protein B0H13DRAFT_644345 [Mycena leptocephala]|nr:hypothetical protein B0H13DRAFT_644345 [Mycena leptocephala]
MTLPLLLWALTVSRLWRPRKPPQDLLPIEVWDLIFTSLTDHALLQTACVCRIFNELSITMYLRRHNVTAATTSLKIPPYLMRSLDLACVTPQIDSLRCKFWTFDVLRHMRSLREVVGKCQDLTEISLSWSDDLFQVHRYDSRVPYSPNALITILRDILRAFADRTPGPCSLWPTENSTNFNPKIFPDGRCAPSVELTAAGTVMV